MAAILRIGHGSGEPSVCAKFAGRTVRSAPIAWSRAIATDADVRCLLRQKRGTSTLVAPGASGWLDPAVVERVELQGAAATSTVVVARLGEVELPLVRHAEAGIWVLDGGPELRERLRGVPAVEIEARRPGGSAVFGFAVVPGRLPQRDEPTRFVVQQRKSAEVSGSHGWLVVRIDDITMGGVLLRAETATGAVVVPPQTVYERDAVEFALADERYVLVVEELRNLLVGADHAELRVDGTTVTMQQWLRAALRDIEAKESAAATKR